jgi:hypothetical protein
MSFQEEKNINICEKYYNFIKQLSEDYLKYITNYKIASTDYLKKLSLNHEKFSSKLMEVSDELKSINSTHIISLTSIIPKVVEQQITNINYFLEGIDEKIINFDKFIKEKNIEFIECLTPFKDIKSELYKKYRDIDKLKSNYMSNIEIAEDFIHKYYIRQNNKKKTNSKINLIPDTNLEFNNYFISLEEQVSNSIQKTKKLESEYLTNISLVKTVEKNYIDISEKTEKNSRKIVCDITNCLKELISDGMVLLRNSFKLPLGEIDTYLNEIVSLDEYTKFDDIIKSSYNKDKYFKPINPEKYKSKFFTQKPGGIIPKSIINRRMKSNSLPKEDLQELDFVKEEDKYLTLKKMIENFDLLETNKYNLTLEEEKLRCTYLTLKILSFEPKSKLFSKKNPNITKEEVEEMEKMLLKKQNRVIFIQQLSQFRTRGIFEIPEKEYQILSRLFNEIAKLVESEEDYDSAVNIIILSQTYYKIINNKKEYLQNDIMNNELFKSKKFWETFTNYSIDKEIALSKQTDEKNGVNSENDKENEEKYSNIVFAQLVPMINNMIEFELDINIVEEIILPLITQYKIGPELAEAIIAPINEKKLENENKQNMNVEKKEEEKVEEQKIENEEIKNEENKDEEIKNEENIDEETKEEKNEENINNINEINNLNEINILENKIEEKENEMKEENNEEII